jgi:hypothetical protein
MVSLSNFSVLSDIVLMTESVQLLPTLFNMFPFRTAVAAFSMHSTRRLPFGHEGKAAYVADMSLHLANIMNWEHMSIAEINSDTEKSMEGEHWLAK